MRSVFRSTTSIRLYSYRTTLPSFTNRTPIRNRLSHIRTLKMSAPASSSASASATSASSSAVKVDISELRANVAAQGEAIKSMKKLGGMKKDDPALLAAVAKLQQLKSELAAAEAADPAEVARMASEAANKAAEMALRDQLEQVLAHRGFVFRSNEIHNGPAGFYDFGPVGCAIKQNLLAFWRQHFILYDNMLEIECPTMTPEIVFKTSGHVDRFTDFMVTDTVTEEPFRADKLLEEYCEKTLSDASTNMQKEKRDELEKVARDAGAMNAHQLQEWFIKYGIKSPSGNPLSPPFPFNLMFQSSIGPSGKSVGYLRPETAQGMFVNFRKLLEFNSGRMPFAAAQIGPAFRNEIAPRQGLLRVREFTLAEIEHFVHPNHKQHVNFNEVAQLPLLLLPRQAQEEGKMDPQRIPAAVAVKEGIINNETLAYYMARTQMFLVKCGVKENKLRFRQHKQTEMAHYASDCWDAEILTSYGWIEAVGHADRAAYDLAVHAKASGADLSAQEQYDAPREEERVVVTTKPAVFGKAMGKKAKDVTEHLRSLPVVDAMAIEKQLAEGGSASVKLCTDETFTLTRDMLSLSTKKELVHTAKYLPNVIEPAFGIGRIFFAILEHTFYSRPSNNSAPAAAAAATADGKKDAKDKLKDDKEKEKRTVFALPPHLAPFKLSILPISAHPDLEEYVKTLSRACITANISFKADSSSGSIGKRYARADEIGIPFGVTIDFETREDKKVTIRERDSMQQIRVGISEAVSIVAHLTQGNLTWQQAYEQYPKFTAAQE